VERSAQWVRAWKPEGPGIHEVFHARFVDASLPPRATGRLVRVAAEVGFHDQAHITKHFKRHVGTTPWSYRRS
jgi:AraC-like DNA-binding protein